MELQENSYTGEKLGEDDYFVYLKPHEKLKNIVSHYTIASCDESVLDNQEEMIHLIPDVSGSFVVQLQKQVSVTIWGPSTKLKTIPNDRGSRVKRIFVEFLPGGMYQVLGVPMRELVDQTLPLCMIKKEICKQLRARFENVSTYDEIVEGLNEVLLKQVKKHPMVPKIHTLIHQIHQTSLKESVKEIAQRLKISDRQLNRYANKYLGMGIKRYAKICNVNRLIKDMQKKRFIDLTFEYDYFDQAHFNHVFKEVCQTTPKEYITNLSTFYNELYKF